jgi:polyisoprenoid-binding protein YceI
MKATIYGWLAFIILAASGFTFIAAQSWQIADGYSIAFSCNSAVGVFRDFKGSILFDEKHQADAKFDVTIDVNSINTGNGLQNKDVKSDEWFDAAKYPTIRYSSENIVKGATGFQATGDLEMHGVKKQLIIPFTFQRKGKGGLFSGTFLVNRIDFGVGRPKNEVDELITVKITVPVTPQ